MVINAKIVILKNSVLIKIVSLLTFFYAFLV